MAKQLREASEILKSLLPVDDVRNIVIWYLCTMDCRQDDKSRILTVGSDIFIRIRLTLGDQDIYWQSWYPHINFSYARFSFELENVSVNVLNVTDSSRLLTQASGRCLVMRWRTECCCVDGEEKIIHYEYYNNKYRHMIRICSEHMFYLEACLKAKKTCASCSKPSKKRCSACKQVYYCSIHCQALDFKQHREDCAKYFWSSSPIKLF